MDVLPVVAPVVLPIAFAPLCLVGIQDKSAHSTQCRPACVARSKYLRLTPMFFAAPDASLRCVMDILNDAPPDRPELGYIDPLTGSEQVAIFNPKAYGFAVGSELQQLLGL